MHGRTVDHVRNSFLVYEPVRVMFAVGQATRNRVVLVVSCRLAIAVFHWARLVALTENQS